MTRMAPPSAGFDRHTVYFPVALSEYGPITRLVLRPQVVRLFAVLGGIGAAAALGTLVLYDPPGGPAWIAAGLAMAGVFTLVVRELAIARLRLAMRKAPHRFPTGPHQVAIGPAGFQVRAEGVESHVRWARVERVDRHRRYLLLRLSSSAAMQVPRSAFASPQDEAEFIEQVKGWLRENDHYHPAREEPPVTRDPDALHLVFTLTIEDYVAFLHYTRWANRSGPYAIPVLSAGLLLLCFFAGVGLWMIGEPLSDLLPFAVLAAAALLLSTMPAWGGRLTTWLARRRVRRRPKQYSLEERQLHLGPDGLYATWEGGDGALDWDRITRVVRHQGRTFLMMGEHSALILPDDALGDPHAFRLQVETWIARGELRHRGPAKDRPPTDPHNPFAPPGL